MKLKTVLKPKANRAEKGCFIGLAIFIFIPFTIGIVIEQWYLLLSGPIGILLIYIFNLGTKGKFEYKNWIQSSTIKLDENELVYSNERRAELFKWIDIESVKIEIAGYDRENRSRSEDASFLKGTENSISFYKDSKKYHFDFYLEDKHRKKEFILLIKNTISPILKDGVITVLTRESTGWTSYSPSEFMESEHPKS